MIGPVLALWLSCALTAELDPAMKALADQAVERANVYRRASGLPLIEHDLALSEGAVAHAVYLSQNQDQIAAGLDAHNEYVGRPGYSEAGAQAGLNGNIAFSSRGAGSVDVWYQTYYHRNPILSPGVTKAGYGDFVSGRLTISVMQFQRYTGPGNVFSPGDRSAGAANAGHPELPTPFPGFGFGNGNPIIAYFSGPTVDLVRSSVRAGAVELTHRAISPDMPANSRYEENEVCLITDAPLPLGTEINVEIEVLQSGVPKTVRWSFATSAGGAFDPGAEPLVPEPDATVRPVIDAESGGCRCVSRPGGFWLLLGLIVFVRRARIR